MKNVRMNYPHCDVVVQIRNFGFAVIDTTAENIEYARKLDEKKYFVYNNGKKIFIIKK